jgi:hypothetical protein
LQARLEKPLTVAQWDKQRKILRHPDDHNHVELGFAMFFLNRTNRSGNLNAGIIGGRDQTGPWKIDARYNAKELVQRIQAIAQMRDRIKLTRQNALSLLLTSEPRLGERIEVDSMDAIVRRLYELNIGKLRIAMEAQISELIRQASKKVGEHKFSHRFLTTEWEQVVDGWQLDTWEEYRDVNRLGGRHA